MNDLIPSFKKTIFEANMGEIGELSEILIDSVLNDGILKDLPIVGVITGLVKTTKSFVHRNLLKQTIQFIKEFNGGTIKKEKLLDYKEKIYNDKNKSEEELGRVLLILNSTIELAKSKMLANLFRNYINGEIDWNEFCEYSEITRMFLINDLEYLKKIYSGRIKDTKDLPLYPFN